MAETDTPSEADTSKMTEEHTGSPHRRLTRWFSLWKWKQHKDIAVLGIGVALSGVSTTVGVAHVGWLWMLALGCAITAIASLATSALQEHKMKDRSRRLWQSLTIAVALLIGVFCYHEWWDPLKSTNGSPDGYQVMVNGTDIQTFSVYDQPGGLQTYEYPMLNSDEPVALACYVSLAKSGIWYEVYGDRGWIPQDAVHAIPGMMFPSPPHC